MKSAKNVVAAARSVVKSAQNVVAFPRALARRDRQDLAFLPAALEIVETPPSPIGRAIVLMIAVFFCAALLWASLGTVDIVASATGKIVPTGRTKVVQPFETGVVRAIHVRDGQTVKAGDVLIELDPTITQAEQGHLQSDLIAAQLDIARLRAAMSDKADPMGDFRPPDGASASLIAMERQYLTNQVTEHRAKLAALDDQKTQREAERTTITATINKLKATIPILEEQMTIRKALLEREVGTRVSYLQVLQTLTESQHDLNVQQSRYQEADAALAAIGQTREQTEAEYNRTTFNDLAEAERKAAGLAHDLDRANEKTRLQRLTAPVDGVVQQLAVHTIGGVVTPAQALLVVVPSDSHLEIEAMVSNRDIGFVHPGQKAQIKVDTFNFTRYGLLQGEVMSVSPDSIVRDKPQDKSGNDHQLGSEDASSEPKGQELNYAARISLEKTQMQIDDKLVNLSPGMAVTVEIKTGSRTIMSYLLSPIKRYSHESMHER